jgi:hypothetical protein
MNGFIRRSLKILCLGGIAALGGCCCDCGKDCRLCDYYDNCWLQRYSYQANASEMQILGAQIHNGHVLEQTVYTHHFEPGTDKLTPGGMEHLTTITRRRPMPDTCLFLQTAQDVYYDPAAPEQFTSARAELDGKRIVAIQRFLNAETAGRSLAFDVTVHNPATPGLPSDPIGRAVFLNYSSFKGALSGTGGVAGGVAGAAAAGTAR